MWSGVQLVRGALPRVRGQVGRLFKWYNFVSHFVDRQGHAGVMEFLKGCPDNQRAPERGSMSCYPHHGRYVALAIVEKVGQ
jgi:hypothetical protein